MHKVPLSFESLSTTTHLTKNVRYVKGRRDFKVMLSSLLEKGIIFLIPKEIITPRQRNNETLLVLSPL